MHSLSLHLLQCLSHTAPSCHVWAGHSGIHSPSCRSKAPRHEVQISGPVHEAQRTLQRVQMGRCCSSCLDMGIHIYLREVHRLGGRLYRLLLYMRGSSHRRTGRFPTNSLGIVQSGSSDPERSCFRYQNNQKQSDLVFWHQLTSYDVSLYMTCYIIKSHPSLAFWTLVLLI